MRSFTRRVEDFVCEHCSAQVKGNGYTNHCPQCLYSKHVDVHPGDREASCGGLMEPVHIEAFGTGYKVVHRCIRCGHERKNQAVPEDNFETLLLIIERETKAKNRK